MQCFLPARCLQDAIKQCLIQTPNLPQSIAKINAGVYDLLDFEDKQESEFALRGLIDAPAVLELKDENGNVIWSQKAYTFLDETEKSPDSVNPSLWQTLLLLRETVDELYLTLL